MVMLTERHREVAPVTFAFSERVKEPKKEPHALLVAGGMGTYQGMRRQEDAFGEHYGGVTVFNSVISTDPTNRRRFAQMRSAIETNINVGVHAVLHSTAAGELSIPLKQMRRDGFFDDPSHADNLHVTLISPASTGGIFGPFRFLNRAVRYAREEAEVPLSKKNTLLRGIETLTAFPPINMPDDYLTKGVRTALADLSHFEEGIQVIPFIGEQTNAKQLSFDLHLKLFFLDEGLRAAIADSDSATVDKLIRRRGELLRKPLNAVYAGEFEETSQVVGEATRFAIGGYIDLLNVVGRSMVNAPIREMSKLMAKGVQVDEVIPEYDIWRSTNEARALYTPEQGRRNIYVATRGAHATHALQPEQFAEVMRDIFDSGKSR